MTRSPITVSPRDTADRALSLMEAAHVDHLPVCEGRRLVGLVARGDLIERAWRLLGRHRSAEELQEFLPFVHLAGVMSLAPPEIAPASPLTVAADRLRTGPTSALAVVEDHELVGILTARDLWPPLADAPQGGGIP